ncbi:MAG: tetratricopeptide repeat protein [Candidatus Wallbacteria bacterium]|nr:tetratricopeptide repeat protein [Candidatus Wallbacteria bacterium]
MYRNILVGIILGLTVLLLILVFLLGNQWYYEGQGDEQFNAAKYDDAAVSFIKSYKEARFLGQGRLLYKIALAYQNNRDGERAMDYYMELVRLYPDSTYSRLAASQVERLLPGLVDVGPGKTLTYATSGIEAAHQKFVRAYQNLTRLMLVNRAGVTPELEAAYQAYRIFHEEYKRQIAVALEKFKAEHPDFVWPPPGTETGPDPVSMAASAPSTRAAPQPAKGRAEPEFKLNIPVPGRRESRPTEVERELSGPRPQAPEGAPSP